MLVKPIVSPNFAKRICFIKILLIKTLAIEMALLVPNMKSNC